jgi:hypothetical protein
LQPLLLQHHIPKTAGTSLRQVTRANFGPDEVAGIEQLFGLDRIRADWKWDNAIRAYRYEYESLAPERKARIRCFVGHTAPLLLQAVDDRPVRAFTLLRDPVARVVSLWRHAQWLVDRGTETAWRPLVEAMREHGFDLKRAYRELGDAPDAPRLANGAFQALFNEQSRQVLLGVLDPREIPFASDAQALERYRARALGFLADNYVVGAQERFSQSVRLFADSFGWRRIFIPRMNVRGGGAPVDEETRSLIRAYNRLDLDLHSHYLERIAPLPAVSRRAHMRGSAYRRAGSYLRRLARLPAWTRS